MSPHQGPTESCMFCNTRKKPLATKDRLHWAKKFDRVKHITHRRGVGGGVLCNKYGALLGNNYATQNMPVCQECLKNQKKSLRK
jgi:hypothetical protein